MPLDDGQMEKLAFHGHYPFGIWEVELGRSKVVVSQLLWFHVLSRSAPHPQWIMGLCGVDKPVQGPHVIGPFSGMMRCGHRRLKPTLEKRM